MAPHNSASLYAGNLDPGVTETILFDIFNQVGTVTTVRICRDYVSKRSLGYAYINYESPSDAERALNTMNYTLIKNRPVRIMWSQRDPSLRRSGVGNIFIKNLDKAIDDKSLHDTFSAFGNILSCKVVYDERGQSRGYGFVHYEKQEDASTAIEKVNGMLINGLKVFVGSHTSRKDRESKLDDLKKSFTNVFLKNLGDEVTEDNLKEIAAEFGEVGSVVVKQSSLAAEKNLPTKFGFIDFKSHDAAINFIEKYNEQEWKGTTITCTRAQKKSERLEEMRRQREKERLDRQSKIQGMNVYVKYLDENIDEDKLREAFSKFGTIQFCRISRDKITKKSRGFGFVCFSSPDEAQKAIAGMMGSTLGSKPLYCSIAMSKDTRRQMMQQQSQMQAPYRGYPPQMNAATMYPSPFMYPNMTNMPIPTRPQQNFMYPAPQALYAKPRWQTQPPSNRARQAPGRRITNAPRTGAMQGPGGANKGYQFTTQVRNQPNAQPAPVEAQATPAQQAPAGSEPLTASTLASAPPEQQKQMLGNAIYAQVVERHKSDIPEFAGKVTGMLLEMDNSELLNLIETPDLLDQKILQAQSVLQQPNNN